VQNLGREANLMHADLSYVGITHALRKNDPESMVAGIELFPEYGKYYGDGHRACNVYLTPGQTKKCSGICPACKKPVTVGVYNRVLQLADRTLDQAKLVKRKSYPIIPLLDILELQLGLPTTSKKLLKIYHQILSQVGNEFFVLLQAPISDISQAGTPQIAQAIEMIRQGKVIVHPGYDGVYGKIEFYK
jgi:PHP family Zn ribbon phosphoesterase